MRHTSGIWWSPVPGAGRILLSLWRRRDTPAEWPDSISLEPARPWMPDWRPTGCRLPWRPAGEFGYQADAG